MGPKEETKKKPSLALWHEIHTSIQQCQTDRKNIAWPCTFFVMKPSKFNNSRPKKPTKLATLNKVKIFMTKKPTISFKMLEAAGHIKVKEGHLRNKGVVGWSGIVDGGQEKGSASSWWLQQHVIRVSSGEFFGWWWKCKGSVSTMTCHWGCITLCSSSSFKRHHHHLLLLRREE